MNLDIHRALPHSVEAEQGVLGSMLLSPRDAIPVVAQKAKSEHFYIPAHQTIFSVLIELWNSGEGIDLITFTQILRDRGLLDPVGGAAFVTSLFTFVPTAANVTYYIDIVLDHYLLREVISMATEAARRSYEQKDEVRSFLAEIQQKFLNLTGSEQNEHKLIDEFVHEALDEIEAIRVRGTLPGLSTGMIDLDRKLGGLRAEQLVIIAGDTGQGKTALGLNIIEHIAIKDGIACGIVSLEMSGIELSQRLIASQGRVDLHRMSTGFARPEDYPRIGAAAIQIQQAPIFIRDDSDVDSLQLRAIGRQLKHKHDIQLLLVDYVQLLMPQSTKDDNRERAMSSAAQALKQMAKELGIVVIALSQVNEQGKLRESRAIGHHADKVIAITHEQDEEDEPTGLAWLHVNKNRSGPTGDVSATFLREYARFEDRAREMPNLTKK